MIARHEERTVEASAWNAFLHDAATVLTVRDRLDGELRDVSSRPFDRAARARLARTLTSDELEAAAAAADRLVGGVPWT